MGKPETGPKVEVAHKHGAAFPSPKPGEHLWVCVSMFRVRPQTAGKYFLDTENLLTIEGPGCFVCEQEWVPGLENTKCPGEPKP